MEIKREFVSGVVEGFYGRPWNVCQRKELFLRLKHMGLNTYLYAPKDDLKHRQLWREFYTKDEMIQMKLLIDSSRLHNIVFVYAISPGLDITFSKSSDIYLLKQKMNQVLNLGCNAFALLFDDIDQNLNATDKTLFHSFAYAQSTITNEIYHFLNKPHPFLFCPTEYCSTRAVPSILTSEYLQTIGEMLDPQIDIMWTGPKVISKDISLGSIVTLTKVLKRRPVIWDNIHANDYDQRRIFLGPYCGRSSKLKAYIRGVLLNPNCEFEANFIPIHTMAQWIQSNKWDDVSEILGSCDNELEDEYVPSKSLELALIDWLKLIYMKENPNVMKYGMKFLAKNDSHSVQVQASGSVKASLIFNRENSLKSPLNLVTKEMDQHDSSNIKSTQFHTDSDASNKPCLTFTGLDETENEIRHPVALDHKSGGKVSETEVTDIRSVEDKNDSCYEYKQFYENLSNQNDEKNNDSTDNPNEMILDHAINLFPLTPMETEDNQADVENLTDSMAMQVDNVYDNTYENMEVIDDLEINSNSEKKKETKEVVLSKDTKSDMECITHLNKASDVSEKEAAHDSSQLTADDLRLLVNMFFLPYEHGPHAIKLLKLMQWLRSHSYYIDRKSRSFTDENSENPDLQRNDNESEIYLENKIKYFEWREKAKEFTDEADRIRIIIDRFTTIPNRAILYDLYPYIQDMRHVLSSLLSYVKWMGCFPGYNKSLMNDDHEPWVFKGGLKAEFQRMFPLEGSNDLFPNKVSFLEDSYDYPLSSSNDESEIKIQSKDDSYGQCLNDCLGDETNHSVFVIRPYRLSNKNQLFKLCFDILYDQLSSDPNVNETELMELKSEKLRNLPGDRYLGAYLEACCDTCMVLEDDNEQICGYACGTNRIEEFIKFRQETYNLKMREKYKFYSEKIENETNSLIDNKHSSLKELKRSNSTQKSIIQTLIDGFISDNGTDRILKTVHDVHCGLIIMDLVEDGNRIKPECSDRIGYRLLKFIVSALGNIMNIQAREIVVTDSDKVASLISKESPYKICDKSDENFGTSDLDKSGSSSLSPMATFCEVETTNRRHANFYKRYGFEACNTNENVSNVILMSKCIQ